MGGIFQVNHLRNKPARPLHKKYHQDVISYYRLSMVKIVLYLLYLFAMTASFIDNKLQLILRVTQF